MRQVAGMLKACMQIWASPFKLSPCRAHKWGGSGREQHSGSLYGRLPGGRPGGLCSSGECAAGKTDFYNEKEKRFTSLDLFLIHPAFSLKS